MDQPITPRDPRTLFPRLFGWIYEPVEEPDPHSPWIMGGDPRERGNLVHAKGFNQHPSWSKCEDRHKWGDILWAEDPRDVYDDRVWICRAFFAYVNFRLKCGTLLADPNENESSDEMLLERIHFPHRWSDVWDHMIRCLRYCLVSITKKERRAIFELLLNTHLWCMNERQTCYRPEFALITAFENSFLWAVPYRDAYRQVKHGLSELEELYESVPPEAFPAVFLGENRGDMQFLSEVNIEGYKPEEVGIPPIYAWDKSGDPLNPESSSCTHFLGETDSYFLDFSDANPDEKIRLHQELGVLLGREMQEDRKRGKQRRKR